MVIAEKVSELEHNLLKSKESKWWVERERERQYGRRGRERERITSLKEGTGKILEEEGKGSE